MNNNKINEIEHKIFNAIKNSDFEGNVYIVGGYNRDSILGRATNDIDLVVSLPNGGILLAKFLFENNVSSHPIIFSRFGTAFIEIDHNKIELVMTRKEFYTTNNRKPDVESGTIFDDAIRRDFTINALYRKITETEILDITQKGKADIKSKIIRTTNNPDLVFDEDPLRMLRAIRFSAQLGFSIHPSTWLGIIDNHDKLQYISWERKRDELNKMLLSAKPSEAISNLKKSALLNHLIPELSDLPETKYLLVLDALKKSPINLELRLAILLHSITPSVTSSTNLSLKILNRLIYSKKNIYNVLFLIKSQNALIDQPLSELSDKEIRYYVFEFEDKLEQLFEFQDILELSKSGDDYSLISELKKRISQTYIPKNKFPITGYDIKKAFPSAEGKQIGVLLEKAYDIWLENPQLKKETILADYKNKISK